MADAASGVRESESRSMRKVLIGVSLTLACLVAWTVLVAAATRNGWFRHALAAPGDAPAFMNAARDMVDRDNHGNVSLALIGDGQIVGEYAASVDQPIDGNTLFQAASLSKWITAWGVMTLVDQGKLDLDAPVSTYLTRWQLPAGDYDNAGVTVRRLLSHTSGLADGLGFAGFAPGAEVPGLTEALSAPNASPGHDGRVRVGYEPGAAFHYSGGGYLLLQLLVEELSGDTFMSYMERTVFRPLGMSRSTYRVDDSTPNVAVSYEVDGTPGVLYQFSAIAAAGLFTSTNDLTRLIQAHLPGPEGEKVGRGVLKPETIAEMRQPVARTMGIPLWGLGTMIFAPTGDGDYVIGHDGSNEPAINTAARLNPSSGDGIVILESGNRLLATRLAGEWVFWNTGKLDILMIKLALDDVRRNLVGGWALILLASLWAGWRARRRHRKQIVIQTA